MLKTLFREEMNRLSSALMFLTSHFTKSTPLCDGKTKVKEVRLGHMKNALVVVLSLQCIQQPRVHSLYGNMKNAVVGGVYIAIKNTHECILHMTESYPP